MRGASGGPSLLLMLAAMPATVHMARVKDMPESWSHVNNSGGRGSSSFICPSDCRECCKHPLSTSEEQLVQCKLKQPLSGAVIKPLASCRVEALENDVVCPLTEEQRTAGVWDTSPNLQWGCSVKFRCCCNAKGLKLCIGDNTPRERLVQQYGLTEEELPSFSNNDEWLNLTNDGFCPPGFSAGNGGCDCGTSCPGGMKLELKPRAHVLFPTSAVMASLAAGVYYLESPVATWEIVKIWTMDERDQDNVAIYRWSEKYGNVVNSKCALVFSGTTTTGSTLADLNVRRTSFCGFSGVHKGFAKKATVFRFGPRADEFMQYLRSDNCGEVSAVGHSLGGAVASLTAACSNKMFKEGSPTAVKFDTLYTYAAPSITETPLQNHLSEDGSGCFRGYRFFLQDSWFLDPVPGIASKVGFKHPRVSQVRVYTDEMGVALYHRDLCGKDNAEALQEPRNTSLSNAFHSMKLHLTDSYVSQVIKAWPGF